MILRLSSRRRQAEVSAAGGLGRCAWRIRTAEVIGSLRSRLLGLKDFDRQEDMDRTWTGRHPPGRPAFIRPAVHGQTWRSSKPGDTDLGRAGSPAEPSHPRSRAGHSRSSYLGAAISEQLSRSRAVCESVGASPPLTLAQEMRALHPTRTEPPPAASRAREAPGLRWWDVGKLWDKAEAGRATKLGSNGPRIPTPGFRKAGNRRNQRPPTPGGRWIGFASTPGGTLPAA